MPDTTPEQILARAQAPATNGRPVRKDEIELDERGIYVESWLPERRSRRKPLLFVHGELAGSWVWERYLGYFAARGWEGHALNLRNHFWSQTADPATLSFDTYTEDVVATLERFGSGVVVIGHGMGGLLALKAAERMPISGLVLLSSELPRDLRIPARQHELREIPEVYGKSVIGWETLPERLLRDERASPSALAMSFLPAARNRASEPEPRVGRCSPACRSTGAGSPMCRGSSSVPGSTRRSRWPSRNGSLSGSTRGTSRSRRIRTTD